MKPVPAAALGGELERFADLCRARGFALTHQRQVIYREMLRMGGHPSPEAVHERVRAHIPSISLGTVYKNLKTFVENGLLREVSLHHGTQRLEANLDSPHHHLVCTRCKSIADLPEDGVSPVRIEQSLPRGFRVERISVEVHGICAACARKALSSS
jgi:Fur family peroxide stress response transcriptional regulator